MFNIVFYNFAKKQNSTARPAGTGTLYSCQAKAPLDKLDPTIELLTTPDAMPTYNYALWESRYYWVDSWTMDGPLWVCKLHIDALASWRDTLGRQSIYVYRSAASWDGDIVDTLYPATTDIRQYKISYSYPIADTFNTTYGAYYVIGLISKTGVVHRIFNQAQFDALFGYLLSDAYYIDVLGIFGAIEYPEAKVAINPLQYVSSVRAYPYNLISGAALVSDYTVGTITMTGKTCYRAVSAAGYPSDIWTWTTNIDLSDLPGHPQQSRGLWVNAAYGHYSIGVPGFGIVQLDPVLVADSVSLTLSIRLDLVTGNAVLRIYYNGAAGSPPATADSSPLSIHCKLGVDVPLSNVVTPGVTAGSILRDALPGAITAATMGLVTGNAAGAIVGGLHALNSTIGNAMDHRIPRLQQLSQAGSLANWGYNPELHAEYTMLATDDLAGRGRPLCAVRRIDTIPGYIMGDPDELSIPCTLAEMQTIRSAVASGFFWE